MSDSLTTSALELGLGVGETEKREISQRRLGSQCAAPVLTAAIFSFGLFAYEISDYSAAANELAPEQNEYSVVQTTDGIRIIATTEAIASRAHDLGSQALAQQADDTDVNAAFNRLTAILQANGSLPNGTVIVYAPEVTNNTTTQGGGSSAEVTN